jgi:hypothetical protein
LGYVRAPLDAAHLHAKATQRQKPSRETLAAFAYAAPYFTASQALASLIKIDLLHDPTI